MAKRIKKVQVPDGLTADQQAAWIFFNQCEQLGFIYDYVFGGKMGIVDISNRGQSELRTDYKVDVPVAAIICGLHGEGQVGEYRFQFRKVDELQNLHVFKK